MVLDRRQKVKEWEDIRMTQRLVTRTRKQVVGLLYGGWGGDWKKRRWWRESRLQFKAVNLRYLGMLLTGHD